MQHADRKLHQRHMPLTTFDKFRIAQLRWNATLQTNIVFHGNGFNDLFRLHTPYGVIPAGVAGELAGKS